MRILPLTFTILCVVSTAAQSSSKLSNTSRSTTDDPPASQTRRKSHYSGVISGQIVGEDGRPISGARVVVHSLTPTRERTLAQQTETDMEGKFLATGLPPAVYTLSASMPGYVSDPEIAAELDGSPRYHRTGDTVNMTLRKGGVITGLVTDDAGDPIIGVAVQAVTAAHDDKPPEWLRPFLTDDRGVYRIYGLLTGRYLVVVNTNVPGSSGSQNALQGDESTFYPSSTRADALEIAVTSGGEVSGIDIRHRSKRGNTLSGSISGVRVSDSSLALVEPTEGVMVIMSHVPTGSTVNTAFIRSPANNSGFAFHGLADGEYELVARQIALNLEGYASAPRRVTVRGKEVTGIELKLTPLGSIAGRFELSPPEQADRDGNCKASRIRALEESIVSSRRDSLANNPFPRPLNPFVLPLRNGVGENGVFILRSLYPDHYRLVTDLPTQDWYVRAITLPVAGSHTENDIGTNGILVKQGERVTGVKVLVAGGAAGLKGRVVAERRARMPSELRVYLIPAEREAAAAVLRYAEEVATDGSFTFINIAPGRYWLLAEASEHSTSNKRPPPASWDIKSRLTLRHAAERAGMTINLSPCQRVTDFEVRYSSAK